MANIIHLIAANQWRWNHMHLHAARLAQFHATALRLCAPEARARFQAVEKITGVPWFIIAVAAEREYGGPPHWDKQLAQGDPLNHVSWHIPRGRGPFRTWEEGAVDALVHCAPYAARWHDWTAGGALTLLEEYNGLGYANMGVPSAYVWSGSDQYVRGKYVRDGVYSKVAVDVQDGCAPIIAAMMAIDPNIKFADKADEPVPHPSIGDHLTLKLGKKPAEPRSENTPLFTSIFHKSLPPAPPVFGHITNDIRVGMDGNDIAGDCAWCTPAHLTEIMQRAAGHPVSPFTAESVLGDYSAATGYNPNDPATDQGTSLQAMIEWWRVNGIHDADGKPHKIDMAVALMPGNLDELAAAAYYCGGAAIGVNLPESAMQQWRDQKPWTLDPSSKILGGHAIAIVGRNHEGNFVIATWDGITAATPEWINAYMDEGFAPVSFEYLNSRGLTPESLTKDQLEQEVKSL